MESTEVSVLVHRAAEGDQEAWSAIVTEYAGLVRSVARGFGLDEARSADAAQTTWLRLVEHLPEVREPGRLAGWLRTTTRRVCLGMVRDAGREELTAPCERVVGTGGDRSHPPDESGPEACAVRRDQQLLVRRAMDTLPERHRALLVLLVAPRPVSYQEISAGLGIPVGSIGPTRARVLARLRTALETAGLDDMSLN